MWSDLQEYHTTSKHRASKGGGGVGGGSILTPNRPLHLLLLQDRCSRQEAVETVQLRQEGQQVVEEGARHGDRQEEQGVQDVRQHGACRWVVKHIWTKEMLLERRFYELGSLCKLFCSVYESAHTEKLRPEPHMDRFTNFEVHTILKSIDLIPDNLNSFYWWHYCPIIDNVNVLCDAKWIPSIEIPLFRYRFNEMTRVPYASSGRGINGPYIWLTLVNRSMGTNLPIQYIQRMGLT